MYATVILRVLDFPKINDGKSLSIGGNNRLSKLLVAIAQQGTT